MKILNEFREFAVKGNVVDMAIGVIIGAAFGKIVTSLVTDIVMPPIGILVGGVDFSDLSITLKAATANSAAVTLGYGKFVQTVFDFLIVAFAMFSVIKFMNSLKRKQEQATVQTPPKQELLLTEIRDILKSK
jgi:large conductance mechanosensitive channel